MNHLEDKRIIRNIQHACGKNKLCSTNLISFYDRDMDFVDVGRVVDVTFFNFSKALYTAFYDILISKSRKYSQGVTRHITGWIIMLKG